MQIKQRRPGAVKINIRKCTAKSFLVVIERIFEMIIAGIVLALIFPATTSIFSSVALCLAIGIAVVLCVIFNVVKEFL